VVSEVGLKTEFEFPRNTPAGGPDVSGFRFFGHHHWTTTS
jgi:hypothetical protein